MSFDGFLKALREIHSEPNGGGLSWGRVTASLAFIASVVWVSLIWHHTHVFPSLSDVTMWTLAPYGANRLGAVATAFSNNPQTASPPPKQ